MGRAQNKGPGEEAKSKSLKHTVIRQFSEALLAYIMIMMSFEQSSEPRNFKSAAALANFGSAAAANREIKTSCNFYKIVTYATPINGGVANFF